MSMNQKLNKSKLLKAFWIKEMHLLLKPVASKLGLA